MLLVSTSQLVVKRGPRILRDKYVSILTVCCSWWSSSRCSWSCISWRISSTLRRIRLLISCTRCLIGLRLPSSSSLPGSASISTSRAISRLCSLVVCFSSSVSCCGGCWLLIICLSRVVRSCWCSSPVAVIVSLSYGTRVSSCKKKV